MSILFSQEVEIARPTTKRGGAGKAAKKGGGGRGGSTARGGNSPLLSSQPSPSSTCVYLEYFHNATPKGAPRPLSLQG